MWKLCVNWERIQHKMWLTPYVSGVNKETGRIITLSLLFCYCFLVLSQWPVDLSGALSGC